MRPPRHLLPTETSKALPSNTNHTSKRKRMPRSTACKCWVLSGHVVLHKFGAWRAGAQRVSTRTRCQNAPPNTLQILVGGETRGGSTAREKLRAVRISMKLPTCPVGLSFENLVRHCASVPRCHGFPPTITGQGAPWILPPQARAAQSSAFSQVPRSHRQWVYGDEVFDRSPTHRATNSHAVSAILGKLGTGKRQMKKRCNQNSERTHGQHDQVHGSCVPLAKERRGTQDHEEIRCLLFDLWLCFSLVLCSTPHLSNSPMLSRVRRRLRTFANRRLPFTQLPC